MANPPIPRNTTERPAAGTLAAGLPDGDAGGSERDRRAEPAPDQSDWARDQPYRIRAAAGGLEAPPTQSLKEQEAIYFAALRQAEHELDAYLPVLQTMQERVNKLRATVGAISRLLDVDVNDHYKFKMPTGGRR